MNFEELVDIVAKLRGPDGCPWDKEQTRESLRPYLIEEFYELIDALEENDHQGMEEESGDLLFQILLQSRLSKEEGKFDINDVVEGIARKMIKRHPHVFGDKDFKTSEDVSKWWQEHKKKEGKNYSSAIGGVPQSLPALIRAQQIQFKAAKVGFDWERIEDVFEKLEEEIRELKDAINRKEHEEIEDELGDLFFVLVRIANSLKINPEDALRKTIKKFIRRFRHMETEASRQDKNLTDMTLAEMDILWNEAKKKKCRD
ncbi:MAG TPA: nucleoside triphosphate pyrophosphohydrolase [Nitrospirae bacterium]|nr:nucleoside triphosphate pyrophosphohydrolase/pyrophosphatase MazG [bacterium BMS3Abin06]HDH11919.1 nucleoside triphosphate pyrophosphohydrolase [Nitrospirota bacterium]HDZ02220.1 nucleoside triphosphate pyrophosphohydrolase [Nitrospirota bacterium]